VVVMKLLCECLSLLVGIGIDNLTKPGGSEAIIAPLIDRARISPKASRRCIAAPFHLTIFHASANYGPVAWVCGSPISQAGSSNGTAQDHHIQRHEHRNGRNSHALLRSLDLDIGRQ